MSEQGDYTDISRRCMRSLDYKEYERIVVLLWISPWPALASTTTTIRSRGLVTRMLPRHPSPERSPTRASVPSFPLSLLSAFGRTVIPAVILLPLRLRERTRLLEPSWSFTRLRLLAIRLARGRSSIVLFPPTVTLCTEWRFVLLRTLPFTWMRFSSWCAIVLCRPLSVTPRLRIRSTVIYRAWVLLPLRMDSLLALPILLFLRV